MDQVRLIEGGLAFDDRGQLAFVNNFGFEGVKRFYAVSNHRQGFVRAWHAHRREAKYVHLAKGSALIGAVRVDDWEHPSPTLPVERFVLSASKPAVLFIPAGFANGFMSLSDDALLYYFSTSSIEESRGDDVRYPARHWDPWQVEER
jgi:dTDP-4-dehydrorhamnose 3,5-epimerase-like enzyme